MYLYKDRNHMDMSNHKHLDKKWCCYLLKLGTIFCASSGQLIEEFRVEDREGPKEMRDYSGGVVFLNDEEEIWLHWH